MNTERSVDKLARYTIYAVTAAIACAFCWYFRNIILYIILAAVISLIGNPVMTQLRKIRIKGRQIPDLPLAILTLTGILALFGWIVTEIIPVVYSIIRNITANMQAASFSAGALSDILDSINVWLISIIPDLDPEFKIEDTVINLIKETFSFSSVSAMVGSVASTIGSIGIGLFSAVFISFFFIKDEHLFESIVGALVPDRIEKKAIGTINDIRQLLSRYFVGLLIEVLAVAMLNFIGLWLIAKLGFSAAIGIAFICGVLNIIPYVGPWIGAAIGTILGLVLRLSAAAAAGVSINFLPVIIILVAIFVVTQLVDNFLLQPLIYSASIKSRPLEIFIVLLAAGQVGGIIGMLVAIPAYTVIRVIASRFFRDVKVIKRLISGTQILKTDE